MIGRFITTFFAVCVFLVALTACSRNTNLTSPKTTDQAVELQAAGHQSWGLYDVTVNTQTGEVETVPMRTADFNASVVRFLQPPGSPIELVIIKLNVGESKLSQGLAAMDITLRHPFPGKTMYRGFDVRGIILANSSNTGKHDTAVKYPAANNTHMINPDGYTRWWNQAEFTTFNTVLGYTEGHYATPGWTCTSTVNPYKLHALGLDVTQPMYQLDPATRATFPTIDGAITRRYEIQFDTTQTPVFKFKYSIDASWSKPDPAYAPKYPVEAFDLKANCQEAYLLKVESFEEIPYYVDQWVSGGNIKMLLTIGDWQASGGNLLDQISHVWVESPTLFENAIDVKSTMEFVESTTPTRATYRITINDCLPKGLTGQQMLITVESASPNTFQPQIEGDTSKFKYPSAPLAAYFVVDVPITNLTPQGDYAYVYFIPDWCGTMRDQCYGDSDNGQLLKNIMTQDIDGFYNDFTHVQVWEGKTNTQGQEYNAFHNLCISLGYSVERTQNDYFDATGTRAIIAVMFSMGAQPPNPPFTLEEAQAMQSYINNGGMLFFMCEAPVYFNANGCDQLFDWLGMLMQYGGGATPEMTDGYTSNITWHFLTQDVDQYHYFTCGEWITQDPHVLALIATEYDEKLILMYPIPLD
jgi:hypothetical protein